MFLKAGRRKSRLVENYFDRISTPDLGERIAESFRQRYVDLKAMGITGDQIFTHLLNHAGFSGGDLKRQGASMVVLAYFFDRCDIFEDSDLNGIGEAAPEIVPSPAGVS